VQGVAHSSLPICAFLVSVLAACGGKSFDVDPDPNAGGRNPGGSSQGGSSAGSGQGGKSSTAGTSTGGTGYGGQGGSAGAACAGFEDAPSSYVPVALINKTSAPIYLGEEMVGCSPWSSPLFQVGDSSGVTLPPPDSCSGSCQSLMDHGVTGCPAICAFPSAVALQPGETLSTSWNGLFQVQRELPKQCIPPDYGTAACQQTMQVQPGTFVFSAVAGRSTDCKATTGGACAACMPTPDGRGGCSISGALIAGQMLNAVTKVQLDASYGIYGSVSNAPAPLPNPGGSSGDVIALRTVELIFTE
jgi:hypothetical protein